MRRLFPLTLVLLAACVPFGKGEKGDGPAPVPAEEISVTALPKAGAAPTAEAAAPAAEVPPQTSETASAAAADASAPQEPAPADADIPPEAAPPPPPPPSPEALACQRKGGEYRGTGVGPFKACIRQTGEGAKRCTKETDCKGLCLARSGTCAPVTPLFGCNEILQADGRRVTLCID